MKKYENVKIELLLLLENDLITSSVDEAPILAGENEDLWGDFY